MSSMVTHDERSSSVPEESLVSVFEDFKNELPHFQMTSLDHPGVTSLDHPGVTSLDHPGVTTLDQPQDHSHKNKVS